MLIRSFKLQRSAVSDLPICTATRSSRFYPVHISGTSATQTPQTKTIKQSDLERRNRAISDAESDSRYTVLSSSRIERSLDSYCYESYDPKAPPFETQQFNAKFRVDSFLT